MVMAVLYNARVPPVVEEPFSWRPAPWGVALSCGALAHVPHGWTTRQLQLRGGADVERAGWAAVAEDAGVGPDELIRLRQVHGASIHDTSVGATTLPEADIAFSARPDRAIAVQVADCVPLLIADDAGAVAAAAHAGWRGTAADVAGMSVRELGTRHSVAAGRLRAAIGPSIGPCCYEVGAELCEAFQNAGWTATDIGAWFVERDGRLFLDLWRVNADQLERAGVPAGHIHSSRLCTACHAEWFFSYRRDGAGTGRLAAYIRPTARDRHS
jgi:YfiH family protein